MKNLWIYATTIVVYLLFCTESQAYEVVCNSGGCATLKFGFGTYSCKSHTVGSVIPPEMSSS
jgi:hypothetical protein